MNGSRRTRHLLVTSKQFPSPLKGRNSDRNYAYWTCIPIVTPPTWAELLGYRQTGWMFSPMLIPSLPLCNRLDERQYTEMIDWLIDWLEVYGNVIKKFWYLQIRGSLKELDFRAPTQGLEVGLSGEYYGPGSWRLAVDWGCEQKFELKTFSSLMVQDRLQHSVR